MKVKALRSFYDKKDKVSRSVGEEFECSAERYKQIKDALPEWVEALEESSPAKKTSKRK